MNSTISRCVGCGSAKVEKKKGAFAVNVRQRTVKIPGIEYYICSRCGETFLDLDNEAKIDLYLERHRTETVTSGSS